MSKKKLPEFGKDNYKKKRLEQIKEWEFMGKYGYGKDYDYDEYEDDGDEQ